MNFERVQFGETVKRVIAQSDRDDITGLSAELAYRFFLALFPFFIFVASLGAFIAESLRISNPVDQIVNMMGESLPPAANSLVRDQLQAVIGAQHPGLLSLGVVGSVLLATAGTNAIIKAMNRAYDVEETRPFFRRYMMALWLTLLGGVAILAAFVILMAGQLFGGQLASARGLSGPFQLLLDILRWPVVILLLLVGTMFLYRLAPNIDLPSKWVTPGALVFAVGWVIASYLFGLYVGNFGSYSNTYGALGGVVVLLVWFYITAFVLLLGAEVNAVLDKQAQPRELDSRRREAEADGRAESERLKRTGREHAERVVEAAEDTKEQFRKSA